MGGPAWGRSVKGGFSWARKSEILLGLPLSPGPSPARGEGRGSFLPSVQLSEWMQGARR